VGIDLDCIMPFMTYTSAKKQDLILDYMLLAGVKKALDNAVGYIYSEYIIPKKFHRLSLSGDTAPFAESEAPKNNIDTNYTTENIHSTRTTSESKIKIVIRKYLQKNGGKKIILPSTIETLLNEGSKLLNINAIKLRDVACLAEIDTVDLIDNNEVYYLMTNEDEIKLMNN